MSHNLELNSGFNENLLPRRVSLRQLSNSLHPGVVLIPSGKNFWVVDDEGDSIFLPRIMRFPFSSYNIYIDHEKGLFKELYSPAFWRLGELSQLGLLVPARPIDLDDRIKLSYTVPTFPHTRFLHSMLVAAIYEIVLARNGFSKKERARYVLTAAAHDIATPAGGDSVKRIDSKGLHEENAFPWVLNHYKLIERWKRCYEFDICEACRVVKNKGLFGRLLDVIDRVCYTGVDCFFISSVRNGSIRNYCQENPLLMDVWQDIKFINKQDFGFINPERLFKFLMLRGFEHKELLKNPYSRVLDFFLKGLVEPLYKRGLITREDLLTHGDNSLMNFLEGYYPEEIKSILSPEEISWKKFDSKEEQISFCAEIGEERIDHIEHIKAFETGLNYKVFKDGELFPLKSVITSQKVKVLEEVSMSIEGYCVYYR